MSNYRKPCGGGRERQWPLKVGCFQQKRRSDSRVQKYLNVSAVPNPACPEDWDPSFTPPIWPPLVAPYTRPPTSRPGRSGYPGDAGYCDEGHPTGLPFGPWKPEQLDTCFDGATKIDLNCYSIVPGEYIDLGSCFKQGFKNVQARHWWYGRFGFESLDGPTACGVDAADFPSQPDAQKYLTLRVYAKSSQTNEGAPETNYSYEFECTWTVNRRTGVITQSGRSLNISTTNGGADPIDNTIRADIFTKAMGFGGLYCAPNFDEEYNYVHTEYPTETQTVTETSTFSRSNTAIRREQVYVGTGPAPEDNSVQTHITEAELSDPMSGAEFVAMVRDLLAEWDMADDLKYPWRTDPFTTVAPLVELNCVPGFVTPLSGAQNGDLGQGDDGWTDPNETLFDGAVLGRPLPFPGAVKVTQDAGGATDFFGPSIVPELASTGIIAGTLLELAHTHVNIIAAELRDGGGALLATGVEGEDYSIEPLTGLITILPESNLIIDNTLSPNTVWINYSFGVEQGGHFDPRHETWNFGTDACDSEIECLVGYGAWSASGLTLDPTDYYMPRCATHWTQNNHAQDLPHGAFQIYDAATNELIMQKWAEIKVPRPSQNFFGPCGSRRWDLKADKTSCVVNVVGDPVVITVPEGEGTRFTAGDRVIYYTGEGTGGAHSSLHTVSSVDGDDIHLSEKIADVPAVFEGGPLLGVLRWAEGEAWPICGRVGLASITENLDEEEEPDGTLTVTLASPAPYLLPGDAVDLTLSDATHPLTVKHASLTVLSVLSDTTFTIDAYDGWDPEAALDSTHVKSAGAPAYWWYDVRPKGDFIYLEWGFNNRDIAIDPALRANQAGSGMFQNVSSFFALTSCVPFTPCYPQVMAITPNYSELDDRSVDDFPNGETFDFGALVPDGRFSSRWQATIKQVMDDIFWAPPPKPCPSEDDEFSDTSLCGMQEDDGTCAQDTCVGVGDDGKIIYAHRPIVEARAALPVPWMGDSAPTLPAGITLHIPTLDELDTPDFVPGVMSPPLEAGSQNNRLDTPRPTNPLYTPWNFWIIQQPCVCAGGRFAEDYKANGVICFK